MLHNDCQDAVKGMCTWNIAKALVVSTEHQKSRKRVIGAEPSVRRVTRIMNGERIRIEAATARVDEATQNSSGLNPLLSLRRFLLTISGPLHFGISKASSDEAPSTTNDMTSPNLQRRNSLLTKIPRAHWIATTPHLLEKRPFWLSSAVALPVRTYLALVLARLDLDLARVITGQAQATDLDRAIDLAPLAGHPGVGPNLPGLRMSHQNPRDPHLRMRLANTVKSGGKGRMTRRGVASRESSGKSSADGEHSRAPDCSLFVPLGRVPPAPGMYDGLRESVELYAHVCFLCFSFFERLDVSTSRLVTI